MRTLVTLAVLLTACGDQDAPTTDGPVEAAGAFGVNDVSFLFPLPANDAARPHVLWLIPRVGERGPGFPASAVDELPRLNADLPTSAGYPSAMITAARFDPCFPRLGGATCQAQLRLIAQAVATGPDGPAMLDDAAAHLFYALSAAEADE